MYRIKVEAVGRNAAPVEEGQEEGQGVNLGGLVIYLMNSEGDKQEVTRVGFARRHTKNPRIPFERQFDKEFSKAEKAVIVLNKQLTGDGSMV